MAVFLMSTLSGCVTITLPEQISASLLPADTSFILNGKAEAALDAYTLPVWRGEDGQGFVLFQTVDLKNSDFNKIVTPGNTSRLLLVVRNDLAPLCQADVVPVEVKKILQINGKDIKKGEGEE